MSETKTKIDLDHKYIIALEKTPEMEAAALLPAVP